MALVIRKQDVRLLQWGYKADRIGILEEYWKMAKNPEMELQ